MDIRLHNTLTGKKEVFKSIKKNEVGIYSCGPTVYNSAHIGNFRTFITGDVLRRVFEYNNYSVSQVMNITDVDDKTIRKSQSENVSLTSVTRKYEELFFEDLSSLNILKPHKIPRATENISEMIALIEKLLEKGFAYTATDGIYFDITKSSRYGELAHLDLDNTVRERISNDEYDKENARDFALWKFHTDDDGDIFYEAPFGKGRPGWHIECSAMSMKCLGQTIDIHTGGSDLIFPHHTNEIAQSEAVTDKKFVNYWVHGGFITVEGKKMSKSLGNVFTLADILARNIDPLAYRYFVLGAHYNTLLNFTWEALEGAETALRRLRAKINTSDNNTVVIKQEDIDEVITENRKNFLKSINDDLDTPHAISIIWEIARGNLPHNIKRKLILDFDRVLGLELDKVDTFEIPENVKTLVEARDKARAEKDFTRSDTLREEIEAYGFDVKDTPEGTKVVKIQ